MERQSRAYVSFTLLPLDQLHAVRVIANCIVLILTLTHQPARTRNQIGASKSVQLLNTLQLFDFSTLPAARTQEPASSTTVPTGGTVSVLVRLASGSSPVDVSLTSPLGRLASSLRSIDQLDRRSRCLTVANNWAYYDLGTVYKVFCMVSRPFRPVLSNLILNYLQQPVFFFFLQRPLTFDAVSCPFFNHLQSSKEDVTSA